MKFENETLRNRSFVNREFSSFSSNNCRFLDCNFSNSHMNEVCFGIGEEESLYVNCVFTRAKIFARSPGHARFEHCDFTDVEIHNFFSTRVQFVNCMFSGKFVKGVINGEFSDSNNNILTNEIKENDFTDAKFYDFDLRNIDFSLQKLPVHDGYIWIGDFSGFTQKLSSILDDEEDLFLKSKVSQLSKLLADMLDITGGNQYFLNRKDYGNEYLKALEFIFENRERL